MREDLIFLLVSKNDWNEYKNNSRFTPESFEIQGFITCYKGEQIEEIANKQFQDTDEVLLIVINTSLLEPKLKYEKEEGNDRVVPRIYGPLNVDAVIDKIPLATEQDGTYRISFSVN